MKVLFTTLITAVTALAYTEKPLRFNAQQSLYLSSPSLTEDDLRSTLKGTEPLEARMVSFSYPDIRSIGVEVTTGPGVQFNTPYPWNWVMHVSQGSYISLKLSLNDQDASRDWYLNVKELSSISGYNYSPIAIDVNGVNLFDHFLPQRDAWRIDHFKIEAQLLQEGENTITIRLQDAWTNYWIENLTLTPDEPADVWSLNYLGEKGS